jgi:hypothetical protein
MEKNYTNIVEYAAEVESSIKEVLEAYGVSDSIKKILWET